MAAKTSRNYFSQSRGRIVSLIVLLLLLYAVIPHLGSFSQSFTVLRSADVPFVLLAVAVLLLTYECAAGTYYFLAQKPVLYRQLILVQAASAFTNRLLPVGLGGLALNIAFLRKVRHTLPQAIAVAGTNNILGLIGHLLVLGILLLISRGIPPQAADSELLPVPHLWLILGGIIVLIAVSLLIFRNIRTKVWAQIGAVLRQLAYYRHSLWSLFPALFSSMLLTICYIAIFYCCGRALEANFPIFAFALVFTGGMIATAATPTPGGLVGTEAGLTAGLIIYGADPSQALAIVLLFRFITYWLPLLPGLAVFLAVRRSYL